MKKRILSLALVALIALSLLPGAVSAESSGMAGRKITVLLPNHEMDTVGFMETETRKFEEETGIQVELINMSWENVADRVMTEMAAKGDSYDVIEFDNAWVPKFVANGWVEPLDGYVTDEIKKGILPGLLEKFSMDGRLYGIAWNNDTRFFMYNAEMLKAAGIENPPRTWMELKEQSAKLQEVGAAAYGFTDSLMQAQSCVNEVTNIVYSFGGDFFDKNGNLTVTTDPAVKAAYEYLVDGLNTSKFIDPGSLTSDYETVANVFNMGQSAFFIQAWPGIYQSANDPEQSMIVGAVAVADYALGENGVQSVLTLPEAMAIPTASKNKDAAWAYIEYMSSKAFDKRKAETIGALPIWSELFEDPDLLELYPHWASFGKQSEYAHGLQSLLWYDEFSNILQIETQKILLGLVSVDEGWEGFNQQAAGNKKRSKGRSWCLRHSSRLLFSGSSKPEYT